MSNLRAPTFKLLIRGGGAVVALALAACDAPSPDRVAEALGMRDAQTFHALPPEAPTTARPVRADAARPRPEETEGEPPVAAEPAVTQPPEPAAGPAVSLRADVDDIVLLPGERAPLAAAAYDSAGRRAALPTVRWRSLAPRVAEVEPGGVLAARVGRAALVAEGDGLTTTVAVRVRPVVRGRVLALDGAPVAGARVRLSGVLVRELTTDPAGRFALADTLPEYGELRVALAPPPGRALLPAAVRVPLADAHRVDVVLLPTTWRVHGGRWAGAEIVVRADAPLAPGGAFAQLARSDDRAGGWVAGWPAARLPVRLALAREFADADTAAFWATVRAVEGDLDLQLFAVARGDEPGRVEVRVGPTSGADAVTHASWVAEGNLDDAELFVRDASILRSRGVVAHELLHALGFAHGTAWRSVVAKGGAASPGWLTADDVAWVQLLYALRATQERERAAFGLGAALREE